MLRGLLEKGLANLARHLVAVFALALAVYIIFVIFEKEIPAENKDVALIVLGIAISWADRVISFHFGSSDGSKRLSEMVSSMASAKADAHRSWMDPPMRDSSIDGRGYDRSSNVDLPTPGFGGSGKVDEVKD